MPGWDTGRTLLIANTMNGHHPAVDETTYVNVAIHFLDTRYPSCPIGLWFLVNRQVPPRTDSPDVVKQWWSGLVGNFRRLGFSCYVAGIPAYGWIVASRGFAQLRWEVSECSYFEHTEPPPSSKVAHDRALAGSFNLRS